MIWLIIIGLLLVVGVVLLVGWLLSRNDNKPTGPIRTNFLWNNASVSTHYYLSDTITNGERGHLVTLLNNDGYDDIAIYFCNEGDYGGKRVSCFNGTVLYSSINNDIIDRWENQLIDLTENKGKRVMGWLFADDSPHIQKAFRGNKETVKEFVATIVTRFERYIDRWVLVLEAEEIGDDNAVNEMGTYLKSVASRPVGIHQHAGNWHMGHWSWVDFFCLQYGFGPRNHTAIADHVAELTRRCIADLGKPVIAWEYSRYGDSPEAKTCGRIAMENGAAGAGNGIDMS